MLYGPIFKFLVLTILTKLINCLVQYQPTWLAHNYIRANFQDLFTSLTLSGANTDYVITFSSSLSGIPMLAFGIKSYQGTSELTQEGII